jgi:dsDNA-specific endonuclease/ATPase MutS2
MSLKQNLQDAQAMLRSIDLIASDAMKYHERIEKENTFLYTRHRDLMHSLHMFVMEHARDMENEEAEELRAIVRRHAILLAEFEATKGPKIIVDEDWDLFE